MKRNITSADYNILLPVMPILSEYRPEDINPEFSFEDIDTDGNIKWAFVVSNDTTVPEGWEEDANEVNYLFHIIDIYIKNENVLEDIRTALYVYDMTNSVLFIKSQPWPFAHLKIYNKKLGICFDDGYYFIYNRT